MAAARPPLGARIKRRRQQLGMKTQAELAARIHERTGLRVSRTTVANWEADVHYPKLYMGALESVLGKFTDEESEDFSTDPDPLVRAVWADLTLGTDEQRREQIFDLRRAKREHARRTGLPPAQ